MTNVQDMEPELRRICIELRGMKSALCALRDKKVRSLTPAQPRAWLSPGIAQVTWQG